MRVNFSKYFWVIHHHALFVRHEENDRGLTLPYFNLEDENEKYIFIYSDGPVEFVLGLEGSGVVEILLLGCVYYHFMCQLLLYVFIVIPI